MKKIFIAMLAVLMAFSTVVPMAHADNSEEVVIGVLGGALGGLLVGSIIGNSRPRERVYIYEQEYVPVSCYTRVVRVWDPYRNAYVKVKKRICN